MIPDTIYAIIGGTIVEFQKVIFTRMTKIHLFPIQSNVTLLN